jgi:hypothetical protein
MASLPTMTLLSSDEIPELDHNLGSNLSIQSFTLLIEISSGEGGVTW